MYGTTRSVEQDDEARPRLLFEAFAPAVRWAVEAGVPFDQARDVLVAAMLEAAQARFADLGELAVGLGRTTRSVRMLQKNPDPCVERRGVNLLTRAEEVIDEAPRTAAELSARLPQLEGFDSGRVALAALLRAGKVVPEVDRRGITRYRREGPVPPTAATPAQAAGVAGFASHLRAVGGAVVRRLRGEPAVQTRTLRATPAQIAAAEADIAAFIAARGAALEARAGADAPTCHVYLGHVAEAGLAAGSGEGPGHLADALQPLGQAPVQGRVEGVGR
ncbi:MAG: hypothetical protein H6706_06570 [Myxococcales bacterium]|nr:hypothetical protein [Myxococcales bacterium]